jgi:hypothetical protein
MNTLCLILTLASIFNTDSATFNKIETIDTEITIENALVDNLGNIYLYSGHKMVKHHYPSLKKASYSNIKYGAISSLDVTNPFKIMVFYKNFNKIVYLDKYLSQIGSDIDLDELGHTDVELVCSSSNGGFWLYDRQKESLFYYNEDLQKVHQSISVKSLNDGSDNTPVSLIEKNQLVYMNIPEYGILVLDQYGGYQYTIPLINLDDYQIIGGNIFYFNNENNTLINYNIDNNGSEAFDNHLN